jgi:hypothetical protein
MEIKPTSQTLKPAENHPAGQMEWFDETAGWLKPVYWVKSRFNHRSSA